MNMHADWTALMVLGMFLVLFIAVWVPCCVSDIVFPMLFIGKSGIPACCMSKHTE